MAIDMFERLFLAHPRSVNETYFQHAATAFGFSRTLVVAGLACLVHAAIPAFFTNTASRKIAALHEDMGRGRRCGTR
jgi:hypothetical protein